MESVIRQIQLNYRNYCDLPTELKENKQIVMEVLSHKEVNRDSPNDDPRNMSSINYILSSFPESLYNVIDGDMIIIDDDILIAIYKIDPWLGMMMSGCP